MSPLGLGGVRLLETLCDSEAAADVTECHTTTRTERTRAVGQGWEALRLLTHSDKPQRQ